MHNFIRAIGFQHLTSEKRWNQILREMEDNFSEYQIVSLEDELDYCEFKKEYGDGFGIRSYGHIEADEVYEREHYLPYFEGSGVTTYADVIVEKKRDREAYIGICEDAKVGVTLMFHILNQIDVQKDMNIGMLSKCSTSVTLSGLAVGGKILLPLLKSEEQEEKMKEESRNRMMLLSAARKGDSEAIASLTKDDIQTFNQVVERIKTEDIFSIVESSFIPNGLECDMYSILGTIIEIDETENSLTGEKLYVFTLDVNELIFDVCVPQDGLIGEPQIGRRFKGDIWMQGMINY